MNKKSSQSRRLTKEIQRAVFERDNYTCRACKRVLPCVLDTGMVMIDSLHYSNDFLVVDHVDGPSSDPSNLQTLCHGCNSSKAGKSEYSFRLSLSLKQLGRCVAYYPSLARMVGLKESIFLCQVLYWSPRGRHAKGPGWIYKSIEEIEEETGMSYREQGRLRKSLVSQEILEEKYERTEHRLYFRINTETLDRLGVEAFGEHMTESNMLQLTKGQVAPDKKSYTTLRNVISYKEQEITQEITHKTLANSKTEPERPDPKLKCTNCGKQGAYPWGGQVCPDCVGRQKPKLAALAARA